MSYLSKLLKITPAATSQMAERLVRAGLVERIENPENRRKKRLQLSRKGMAIVDEGIKRQRSWIEAFEQTLSKEEYGQVIEMFEILAKAADNVELPQ